MKQFREFRRALSLLGLILTVMFFMSAVKADEEKISAKDDYVTCEISPCVSVAGIRWSRKNPNGVAVSVRMGKKAAVTDDQIKQILTADLNHYGVRTIKFFFENFDGNSSAINLHVRGGVEGVFTIANVRNEIEAIARRAKNTNPLFSSS